MTSAAQSNSGATASLEFLFIHLGSLGMIMDEDLQDEESGRVAIAFLIQR